jgi:hypothetical protein
VQNNQPVEVPIDCLVDAIDGLQLVSDGTDGVGERHVDAAVIVAADVAPRVDEIIITTMRPRAVSITMNCWPIV